MSLDRRAFLACTVRAAGVAALNQIFLATPTMASSLPAGLAADPRRPQYHFLPAANWMNDPNGPIYWNGHYHMFYQYNPDGAYWGNMHWGHAISPDMVHWKHLPIALAPTPGGPDSEGCFTGTAVVQDGKVVLMYTGIHAVSVDKNGVKNIHEAQCIAFANDPKMESWTKLPNPVIGAPPPGLELSGFRDPSPWHQGDHWYTIIGSGFPHKGGAALLYKSSDLRRWEYVHVVAQGEVDGAHPLIAADSIDMWECPELFPLGDKHVLIYSAQGKGFWQLGRLGMKEMLFHPEKGGILDYGSFYAPKTQLDKFGNRILWGWVQETRNQEDCKEAGWAGLLSLPRLLRLDRNGRLIMTVAEEANALRSREQVLHIVADEHANKQRIAQMRLDACSGEMLCTMKPGTGPFAMSLQPDQETPQSNKPWVQIQYDPQHPEQVTIDGIGLPISIVEDQSVEIHLYVDGSVIEVFVNDEVAYTKRFYSQGSREPAPRLKWEGRVDSIERLSLWQLSPISSDRLTT